jgi:hypothetical protein
VILFLLFFDDFIFIIFGPVNSPMEPCAHLGCVKEGRLQCTRCKQARYCGEQCQRADWQSHKKQCKPAPERHESAAPERDTVIGRVVLSSDRSTDAHCAVQWRAEDSRETLMGLALDHTPAQFRPHCMLTFHNAGEDPDKGTVLRRDDVRLDFILALLCKTFPRGDQQLDWETTLREHTARGDSICCATFVYFLPQTELPHCTRQLCTIRVAATGETVIVCK